MTTIDVSCDLQFDVATPTSFLFNVAVRRSSNQHVDAESVVFEPHVQYIESAVGEEGNRIFRAEAQPGPLRLQYAASVRMEPRPQSVDETELIVYAALPDTVLPYLNPSRYCESDRLVQLAEYEFGTVSTGYERVRAVRDWIGERLMYVPGTTDWRTTACDVLVQRTGVCRDYAHLAIALCRALSIPARYVSAYALHLEPADFHGYFEAYLGSNWHAFDPTGMASLDGLIRIGVGRDAADASFATVIGMAALTGLNVAAVQRDESGTTMPASNVAAAPATGPAEQPLPDRSSPTPL